MPGPLPLSLLLSFRSGDSVSNQYSGNGSVLSATWSCEEKCFGCTFRLGGEPLALRQCHRYEDEVRVSFTETVPFREDMDVVIIETIQRHPEILYVAVALMLLCVVTGVAVVAVWKRRKSRAAVAQTAAGAALPQGAAGQQAVKKPGLAVRAWVFVKFHARDGLLVWGSRLRIYWTFSRTASDGQTRGRALLFSHIIPTVQCSAVVVT